ncbi:hypothetical protein [Streptosporangium sp. NPDC000396]|uniref:hypothetical protein n=1 Tax=Streptosporangium sp. NPDC000396 TaxID=3366185 RepID=UPI0036C2A2A3
MGVKDVADAADMAVSTLFTYFPRRVVIAAARGLPTRRLVKHFRTPQPSGWLKHRLGFSQPEGWKERSLEHVLLSLHVLASIVFVGGSAVATSLFPRYAPVAAGVAVGTATGPRPSDSGKEPGEDSGERNQAAAVVLHRITRVYSLLGLVVPVAGITLANVQGRMGEIWIIVSMTLTAVAGGLLVTQIYPRLRDALSKPDDGRQLRTLSMLAGIYNLMWAIVVVLMIVRPGSGSGV